MGFILFLVGLFFACVIICAINESSKFRYESKILEDDSVSEEIKQEILDKRKRDMISDEDMRKRLNMYKKNMAQSCTLENVYQTYYDNTTRYALLTIYDDHISYEENKPSHDLITHFSISYDKIIDAKCDTSENLTAMRLVALGVLAFAFKKKTYYTVITYKNELTDKEDQLIFRVHNPDGKDEFINNLIVKRNQYLIQNKKTI